MMAMQGLKRSLCMVLGLLLLSLACNAKKLWGVDVGKKEEKGEFASLLQKATSQDSAGGGGVADEAVGTMLAALADADLSSLSLSELCTSAIDAVLEIVKDEEWLGQFAEPGVVGELAQNAGLSAALEDEGMASVERDDLLELLSLESSPILYKTKFYEISEKWIGKLVSLRMDVANPAKLVRMIRDMLQAAGLDEATIAQVMEIVEHPEVLAAQIKEFATNPLLKQQLTSALDGFMSAANAVDDLDLDSEEMMQMLSAMGNEDPEMMEQMLAEMMKDPAFAELMAEEGGAAAGAGGGGGIFKGAGRQGREAEL